MKFFNLFIIIFLLLYTEKCLPQEKEFLPEVTAFMNIVEEKYNSTYYYDSLASLELTNSEIDDICRKLYTAVACDPEGYMKYITKKIEQYKEKLKEKKIDNRKITFSQTIGILSRKIHKPYIFNETDAYWFRKLITTPYFLRIKIISYSIDSILTMSGYKTAFNLKGEIEDVLKGNIRFKKGDTVAFSYLEQWSCSISDPPDPPVFKVKCSYFIPLTIRSDIEGLCVQFMDDCAPAYPIKDEIITPTYYHHFNMNGDMMWEDFKEQFKEKFILEGSTDI